MKKPRLKSDHIPGTDRGYFMYGWEVGLRGYSAKDLRIIAKWFRAAAAYMEFISKSKSEG